MRDTFEYMRRLFDEHKDPEKDACIFICTMTAIFYMSLFVLISYNPVLALIAFAMLAAAVIYIARQWQYRQEQSQKEAEKRSNYTKATIRLMKKPLNQLANTLSLAPTEYYGLKGTCYMQATEVIIISLFFLRKPEAEPLDDFSAERYRQILNASMWKPSEPHICGDYYDFPIYFTEVFEMPDSSLCMRAVPCIEEKARLTVAEYDKQKRERAAREREEMQQALSQLKL